MASFVAISEVAITSCLSLYVSAQKATAQVVDLVFHIAAVAKKR